MVQLIPALTFTWALLAGPTPAFHNAGSPGADKSHTLAPRPLTSQAPVPANPGARLIITRETEIRLDGRLCSYEQVPATAVITFAEVEADLQTAVCIHYRSAH
jgi:hypothetical protein